jgi:hypothetical protein
VYTSKNHRRPVTADQQVASPVAVHVADRADLNPENGVRAVPAIA